MRKLHALLATAAWLTAAGTPAQAQQWDSVSTFQKSTDMMIPPILASTILGPSKPMTSSKQVGMDADDRRTAEFIAQTDMMMPQMEQPRRSQDPHAITAGPQRQRSAAPLDPDDQRTAEFIRRTDQMRPH